MEFRRIDAKSLPKVNAINAAKGSNDGAYLM
jgi:hypothetical protein